MRVLRVRKGARTHSDELLTWKQVLSVGTPVALAKKTWLMVNTDCPHAIHRTDKGTNTMGVKHSASIGVGEYD